MRKKIEFTTNQKIIQASVILIIASVLGHLLSLLKEILVANYFGITKAMDAFYAAITIPNFLTNIFVSTFGAVFIPVFIKYKLKGREESNRVASILTNYFFLFFVLGAILIYIFAPWIIRYGFHGFDLETNILAIKILRLVCFVVIFSGMIGIMTGILNAYEHFTWPAFSQMFITISTILFIMFFVKQFRVFVLVYGLIIGLIIQFLFLILITKKKGFHYYFDFNWKHPAIKEMLISSGILLSAIIMAHFNLVVDRVMASYLVPGSIAALGYAEKLVNVPLVIFSSSIATAVFPFFSSQVVENKIDEIKDSIAKSMRMSGFIFIPLTVMTVVLARPIIKLLFERGVFTSEATDLTSAILICYSFQFFFFTAVMILGKVFLAFQDVKTLLNLTFIGVVLNVSLNFIFMKLITPPVAGIALSTSVVYFIIAVLELIILKKKMIYLHEIYVLEGLIKMGLSSIAMGAGIYLIFNLCQKIYITNLIMGQIVHLGISILAGMFIFTICSVLFKIEELNKLKELIYAK